MRISDWSSDVCSSDLNALDNATVLGLQRFFAAPPAGVKVVVLDGQGDHFSAGLDLSATQELSATEGVGHSMMWHEAFRHIQFGRVPVIAVLHGEIGRASCRERVCQYV